jgi:NTE family protein
MSKVVRQMKKGLAEIYSKDVQRAVIFQGGGAIGAYAAGVYAVLYHWVKKNIVADENVFDIVAGSSAGAINACIIVSHVIHNKNNGKLQRWEGSVKKLLDFWYDTSSSPDFTKWKPFFSYDWPFFKNEDDWISVWNTTKRDNKATGEAARRYYSAKEFLYSGAPKVFSHYTKESDERFYDNFWPVTNEWYRYNNRELKESIKGHAVFPIHTSLNDPRLLMVAVDVQQGEQVTFDSHSYGVDFGYNEEGNKQLHIGFSKGLMPEHVMASASVPVHYDYALVPSEYDYNKSDSEIELETKNARDSIYRKFWDGGILSNTPLREVIQAHQNSKKEKASPSPLKIYIIDVWPSVKHYKLATDHDGVINRKNDLIYQDKTFYEEKVTDLISDFKSLVEELHALALKNNLQTDLHNILKMDTPKSRERDGKPRKYSQLIETIFDIDITRIERTPDDDEVSFKWCDYSEQSINNLIIKGMEDTMKLLTEDSLIRNNNEKTKVQAELELFNDAVENEKQYLGNRYLKLLVDKAISIMPT